MSKISDLIQSLEIQISKIEKDLSIATQKAMEWTNSHHGLSGMHQATKKALDEAKKVVDDIAPDSSIAVALNVAEKIDNVADKLRPLIEIISKEE